MKKNNKALLSMAILAAGMFGASVSMAATDTFKVGMEITYPPFESYDKDKNVVGSDPELATALAKHMNAKVEFVDTKFPSLILGLNSAKYDAVISGMYITPERQTQAQTIAYANTGASVMVPQGSEINAKKPEDLCGLKLGLEQGTTWVKEFRKLSDEYCVPNNKGAITVSEYPSAPK